LTEGRLNLGESPGKWSEKGQEASLSRPGRGVLVQKRAGQEIVVKKTHGSGVGQVDVTNREKL